MRTQAIAFLFVLTAVCGLKAQAPQPGPVLSPGSNNTWNLDWEGVYGRGYFLQHSDDLVNWQYFPLMEMGWGSTIPYGFASSAEKFFVRLRLTDDTSDFYGGDYDGDGISNWDEIHTHGIDPFNADTDGDGVPDGAEIGAGTDPNDNQSAPDFWWQRTTRDLQYDFDDYEPPNDTGTLVRTALWDTSLNSTDQLSAPIPFPELKERLVELVFPATLLPTQGASGLLQAEGHSTLLPNPPCYHATLEHHRVWLRRPAAVAEVLPQKVTIVTKRTIDGTEQPLEFDIVTLTIPSGQSRSQSLDIAPGFQEAFSGNEFHSEEVIHKPFRTEIVITKDGESSAPADGLVVKISETVRYRLFPDEPDSPLLYEDAIKWYWRILKWDGTYSAWTAFQDGQGHTFTAQPLDAGIYEVKAVIDSHTVFYVRAKDDPHSPKKKGDNECFGVVDEQWQLNVRDNAKSNLGSVAYAQAVANSNVPAGPPGGYKCNLFVGHKATDAGAIVPKINGRNPFSRFHPSANQWADIEDTIGAGVKPIPNWTLLPAATYPQPGFVVARGAAGAIGHTGIVDYDGAWISAGTTNVNRIADVRTYIPSRFRKYTP